MQAIPEQWRANWCGGEHGACACMGCVQIGNRKVIAEKIIGKPYNGDPEYISEEKLKEHGDLYVDNKITREEWESWLSANPTESQNGLTVLSGSSGCRKSTVFSKLLAGASESDLKVISLEDPIEFKVTK